MYYLRLTVLCCCLSYFIDGFPSISSSTPRSVFAAHRATRSRFRRRELVQEEVRKTMLTYMTSLKGEITDVVLEEMIDYYNSQTSKLYRLEKELVTLKNSSLPVLQNGSNWNDLIGRISNQQRTFASNMSTMEQRIGNLTNLLQTIYNEIHQQQKPVQHSRRLFVATAKKEFDDNELPTG